MRSGACSVMDHVDDVVTTVREARAAGLPIAVRGGGHSYAPPDEPEERVSAMFGAERFARLRAIKRRYDPENVFRFNHGIPPASTAGTRQTAGTTRATAES